MTQQTDAIIIGAGHNGLVTAVQLAKSGKKVLVLERREVLGGIAATEELFPGCKVSVGPGEAGLFADEIVQGLFLKMHGLEFRESETALFAPSSDGQSLTIYTDIAKTQAEIARFSQADAEKWPEFVAFTGRMTAVLHQMRLLTPPDTADRQMTDLLGWGKIGLKLKGLGKREMMEFIRLLPLPVTDFLREWFESEALIGALAGSGVTGLMLGPGEAGTALMWLYQGGVRAPRFVPGGTGKLAAALARAAQADGAEIRTGTAVSRILVRDGKAVGVELANGETIEAHTILSSADPRHTFFDLVGAQELEPRFMRAVRSIRFRGSTAQLHLLLNDLPQFGQTDSAQLGGKIVICPSARYLQTAYDEAKYGRVSTHPTLEILIPTLHDPTLAPAGQHLMSVTMRYAPYHLRESSWDEERAQLQTRILETLAEYTPNLQSLIANSHLITPLDFEQTYGLTEGSLHHGQMALDQLLVMRPVPGWGRYRTPIDGLYLCGSGAHPGGGLTGAPGWNAARETLADLK